MNDLVIRGATADEVSAISALRLGYRLIQFEEHDGASTFLMVRTLTLSG